MALESFEGIERTDNDRSMKQWMTMIAILARALRIGAKHCGNRCTTLVNNGKRTKKGKDHMVAATCKRTQLAQPRMICTELPLRRCDAIVVVVLTHTAPTIMAD